MASDGNAVLQLGSEITMQFPGSELGNSSPIWEIVHREQVSSASLAAPVFLSFVLLVATFVLVWFHGLRELLEQLIARRR